MAAGRRDTRTDAERKRLVQRWLEVKGWTSKREFCSTFDVSRDLLSQWVRKYSCQS